MAKQIKGNDIIEDGALNQHIKDTETLLANYVKLDTQIVKTAKDLKKMSTKGSTGSAKGIKDLSAALSESEKKKAAVLRIDKERANLEVKLKALNSEKIAQNDILKRQISDQLKTNKAIAEGARKLVGTEEKLIAANKKLRAERKKLNTDTKTGAKRLKEINSLLDKNNAKLEKNSDKLKKQRLGVGRYGKALNGLKGGLAKLGLAVGAAAVLKDVFNVTKDFDQAQANLSSVLGVTREEMGALTEQAKELGATTKFTASQVSELQLEYAKLGFTQQEIDNVTASTLQLASAAGTDLANAATITGSTLRAFGLDSTETQRVVDVMAKSFSASSLDIDKFKVAMSAAAPVAKTFGFSIEETTALIGTLTDQGIDASAAGTGLRNMFLDVNKAGLTFQEALDKINNSTDKAGTSFDLFGKRGATLGVILAENQTVTAKLTKTLNDSGGAAEEMADKQLDTLQGSLDLLRSAWEGFILGANDAGGASDKLKGIIKFLADNLNTILNTIGALAAAFTFLKLTMIASNVVTKIKIALDKLHEKSTKRVTIAQKLLNLAMKLNPVGLVIIAITALVAIIIIMKDEIMKATSSWENFGRALLESIPLMGQFTDLIYGTVDGVRQLTDAQSKEEKQLRRNNKVNTEAIKIGKELLDENKKEIAESQNLLLALTDENLSREERNQVIDKLNEKYPELLKNIDLETASTAELLNLRKDLTKQILLDAIAVKKAAAQEFFFNQIIDKQVALLLATSDKRKEVIQKEIEAAQQSIVMIEEIAAKVIGEVDGVVSKLDFTGRLEQVIAEIETFTGDLNEAIAAGNNELADKIRDRLEKLEIERRNILGIGLETEKEINEEKAANFKTSEEEKTETLRDELKKRRLMIKDDSADLIEGEVFAEDKDADLAQFVASMQDETTALEIELRKRGASEEEIRDALDEKELEDLIRKRDFILLTFGEHSREFLDADLAVRQELAKRRAQDEKDEEDAKKKRKDDLKKMRDESLKIFKEITDGLQKNIDKRIASRQLEIEESQSEITRLQALADKGNTDAAESIKAERANIAREKLEIEALEKKKRNLLIITTALEKANQNISNGDGNPFKNASASITSFIAGLPTFYQGTNTTVADALGSPNMSGRDGYVIRADGSEKILNPQQSALTGSMSTDEITRAALMYQNNLVSSKAVGVSPQSNEQVISHLTKVEDAIKNFKPVKIVQQHIDLKSGKEVIIDGNKTIHNDHNPRTFKI